MEQAMKGMLNFLEKAGLVKSDPPAQAMVAATADTAAMAPTLANPAASAAPVVAHGTPLNPDAIYAAAGLGAPIYPAERLLRLIDGLSAMDPATRLMAIQAMDAADESWTIADPLADASAKVQALSVHAQRLQSSLQQLEHETQVRLHAVVTRQEQVVGDIRKQIAELEALVARELARSAQEAAAQETALNAAREQTRRELADLAQISQRLQGLTLQFGATTGAPTLSQE